MTEQDKDTLKILEDLIRRVVREELERHRPSAPLFDGRKIDWIASTEPRKHWGLDIPSNGSGTPVEHGVRMKIVEPSIPPELG